MAHDETPQEDAQAPDQQIAEEAVGLLLDRIAHPDDPPRQLILAPELVVWDSSGPHRS